MAGDKNKIIENYVIEEKIFSHHDYCKLFMIQLPSIMRDIGY